MTCIKSARARRHRAIQCLRQSAHPAALSRLTCIKGRPRATPEHARI